MSRPSAQLAVKLVPVCLLLACEGESPTAARDWSPPALASTQITDFVVASLSVAPDSLMVFAGDQFQIVAKPKNKAGQVLDRAITWSVANTSIATALDVLKATMPFKALRVGQTSVKAAVDGKSRFAKVIVRSVTGARVVVTPAEATVASGTTVQFVAGGLTKAGEQAAVNVTWSSTGGVITSAGLVTGGSGPGTFRVIALSAFGAADTSVLTVTPAPAAPTAVVIVPDTVTLPAGSALQFTAYGRTSTGDSMAVPVTYTATGGTVATSGVYTAGHAGGTYLVVARTAAGIADTAGVVVTPAPVVGVSLRPTVAASRAGETTRFSAALTNALGDTLPASAAFAASCGAVTSTGVFTAPVGEPGPCIVTATLDTLTDSTAVVLLSQGPDRGTPFGIFDLWTSAGVIQTSGVAAFASSHDYVAPGGLIKQIDAARARGIHLVLAMTGGSHERYKTNGVFDRAKWNAAMDAFRTPAILQAVADAVSDGTVIGNSVMDEPQQPDRDTSDPMKSWGPSGTMTKLRVDSLCGYVKSIFPTLPVGIGHDPAAFQPDSSYRVCEFFISQYAARKGSVLSWRDGGLRIAERDGMSMIFSLNLLDGGIQKKSSGVPCPIPATGGEGTHGLNCRMTAAQVREWGNVLGASACALLAWRYDGAFMANFDNQAAFSDVAINLSHQSRRDCTRH